jgi:hypothetical protein
LAFSEVRAQHQEPGEVKLPGSQRVEQRRKAPDETRCRDATKCFVLRETELVHAIRVEAGAGAGAVDAARFHLGEVSHELGHEPVRATNQAPGAGENLVVREVHE